MENIAVAASRPVSNARRPHDVPRVSISFDPDKGRTHQSFKDECDINRIVETYARTGIVTHTNRLEAQYGDAPSQNLYEAACVQAEIRSAAEEAAINPPSDALRGSESDDQEQPEGALRETPETDATASENASEAES